MPKSGKTPKQPAGKPPAGKAPRAPRRASSPAARSAGAAGRLPELVPQPHGGALYRGGVPGNKANRDRERVTNELRERMQEGLSSLLAWTEAQLGGKGVLVVVTCPECGHQHSVPVDLPDLTHQQRMDVLNFFAKYGLGTKQELTGAGGGPIILGIAVHPGHLEPADD